jgi:hypothetical protein
MSASPHFTICFYEARLSESVKGPSRRLDPLGVMVPKRNGPATVETPAQVSLAEEQTKNYRFYVEDSRPAQPASSGM